MPKFKHTEWTGGLEGQIEYNPMGGRQGWQVKQDIQPFIDDAKNHREQGFNKKSHYRKFASIPDVVAIEIATKYGVNIHDPATASDKDLMKKFKKIIIEDYPYLLVSS